MPQKKASTKKLKPYVIGKKELFQIVFFIGLCWYMARCGATHKTAAYPIENRSNQTSESRKRVEIVRYAKKHIGSKYKYAGRSPKGFDCSGFTHYVMSNFNVDLVPVSREQEKQGKSISVSQVQPGDLMFFRRTKNGPVYHVALVVSNDRRGISVVHSSSKRGVVLDNITENSYWKSKYQTARDVLSN